jgi:hypothetical protein
MPMYTSIHMYTNIYNIYINIAMSKSIESKTSTSAVPYQYEFDVYEKNDIYTCIHDYLYT